jgi:hypothetical protein
MDIYFWQISEAVSYYKFQTSWRTHKSVLCLEIFIRLLFLYSLHTHQWVNIKSIAFAPAGDEYSISFKFKIAVIFKHSSEFAKVKYHVFNILY